MHVVVVFMEVERDRVDEVCNALETYSETCREDEPGCLRYDVSVDPVDGTSFLLYQVYTDEAAFLTHRELPHYARFRTLTDPWTRSRRVLTYDAVSLPDPA